MIAFMIDMNVFLKPSSDINTIQNVTTQSGFNSTSKVSFDMFKFNSMMNDFRSNEVSSKPELFSRQSVHNEKFSQRMEEINKESGTFERSQDIHDKRYSEKPDQINRAQKDSEYSTNVDKKNLQEKNTIDGTSRQSKEQTEVAFGRNDQCSDGKDKCTQQPINDAITENEHDRGHHIGLFLSNILNNNEGDLSGENLLNEGEGSIVSELAQSGNKSESEIDLKSGNLLSHLIKGEIGGTKISGMSGSQTGSSGEIKADELAARMNNIQSGTAEAGADGKSSDAVNGKLSLSEPGIQAGALPDSLSEKSAKANEGGFEENLMKVQIKAQASENGNTREASGEVHDQSGKNTDESGRSSIEPDRKADIKGNYFIQNQNRIADSTFKEMQNSGTVVIDKPLTHLAENIQTGTASKVSTDSNLRTEGIRTESNSSGMLNNSNNSHESIKTGEGLKTISPTRPSTFNEVVDKITYLVKGGTKMNVKVESESLGKLNINVSIEKGLVNVHINSADKAVRELVESNMQQIVDSLSKNGVSVGGFSVGLRNNKNNESNENMNGNGRGNSFSLDRTKEREYISTASRVTHNNGLVNIFA
jgi:flagellar hook-length control protein FliK